VRRRPLDKSDPRAARNAFLDTLPAEEQALVLRQAEKLGPLPSDSDWLVAYAAERSATRIEAAIASFEARASDVAKKAGAVKGPRVVVKDRAPYRELTAFASSLAAFAGIAWAVTYLPIHVQSLVVYSLAIALGVAASALYAWLSTRSPHIR
jgi:hypothetical protein